MIRKTLKLVAAGGLFLLVNITSAASNLPKFDSATLAKPFIAIFVRDGSLWLLISERSNGEFKLPTTSAVLTTLPLDPNQLDKPLIVKEFFFNRHGLRWLEVERKGKDNWYFTGREIRLNDKLVELMRKAGFASKLKPENLQLQILANKIMRSLRSDGYYITTLKVKPSMRLNKNVKKALNQAELSIILEIEKRMDNNSKMLDDLSNEINAFKKDDEVERQILEEARKTEEEMQKVLDELFTDFKKSLEIKIQEAIKAQGLESSKPQKKDNQELADFKKQLPMKINEEKLKAQQENP